MASKKTLLIVEDEESLLKVLKNKLEEEHFTVFTASNGIEGLGIAASEKPSVIVLDVIMPKMHGKDMLKKLRENKALEKIPVIFLTNLEDDSEIERIIKLDTNCTYLTKTKTSLEELIKAINAKTA